MANAPGNAGPHCCRSRVAFPEMTTWILDSQTPIAMPLTETDHDLRLDTPLELGERTGLLLLILLVPAILVLDFYSGRDFSLHLFYLIPVGLAAWSLGSRAGFAIAVAAAVAVSFVAFASRSGSAGWGLLAWDVVSALGLFLFVAFLVARHRRFVDGLHAFARMDKESGALSRREFERLFESEVKRARRYGRSVAVVLAELAEGREGATRGKGFFPALVRAVLGQVREGDSVGRLAPRRFAIVLVECPLAEAIAVAGRIRESLTANLRVRKGVLAFGVAGYAGGSPISAADLMALAESHLLLAKGGSGIAESSID